MSIIKKFDLFLEQKKWVRKGKSEFRRLPDITYDVPVLMDLMHSLKLDYSKLKYSEPKKEWSLTIDTLGLFGFREIGAIKFLIQAAPAIKEDDQVKQKMNIKIYRSFNKLRSFTNVFGNKLIDFQNHTKQVPITITDIPLKVDDLRKVKITYLNKVGLNFPLETIQGGFASKQELELVKELKEVKRNLEIKDNFVYWIVKNGGEGKHLWKGKQDMNITGLTGYDFELNGEFNSSELFKIVEVVSKY